MISLLLQWPFLLLVSLGLAQNTGKRAYKILGALPIGSSWEDINRFSKALVHYETNFYGTVDWALFHYKDIDVWKAQPWYKTSNIVLSINEVEFAYFYFYTYLTTKYISNLHEYDWIWLMVSDSDFEVFDAQTFVDLLELWNPGVAQPANSGHTYWVHTRQRFPSEVRVTNLVEVGPLLSIRARLWEDFRGVMNPKFNSGWGIDNMLCTYIGNTHGYILDPFNNTDLIAKPPRVWLSHRGFKNVVRRSHVRLCPYAWNSNPACLIVDASPLKHLNFLEGKKSGIYNHHDAHKELVWYRRKYPEYFLHRKKVRSYCIGFNSSVTLNI